MTPLLSQTGKYTQKHSFVNIIFTVPLVFYYFRIFVSWILQTKKAPIIKNGGLGLLWRMGTRGDIHHQH